MNKENSHQILGLVFFIIFFYLVLGQTVEIKNESVLLLNKNHTQSIPISNNNERKGVTEDIHMDENVQEDEDTDIKSVKYLTHTILQPTSFSNRLLALHKIFVCLQYRLSAGYITILYTPPIT